MADADPTIRRTLHLRFTLPAGQDHLLSMMKSAAPFYQWFGEATIRIMRNADDPARCLQVIEYDTPASIEVNRQQVASDVRVQTYLQAWRAMFPGAFEIDVWHEV